MSDRIALGQFLEDDLLFELQMLRIEMRPARDRAGGPRARVGRQQARIEGGQLAVGRGTEIAAHVFDQLADLARGAPPAPLKPYARTGAQSR